MAPGETFKAPFLISLVHKGGLQVSNISRTWKLDRNVKSWPTPHLANEMLLAWGGGPHLCFYTLFG